MRYRLAAILVLAAAAPAAAQIPDTFQNLEVLPEDIARDSLIQIMRGFSFATGLRCEGCHVLGENNAFQGARFHLDEKQNKLKAREMLRMVARINEELLTRVPHRTDPPILVECKTCHRGYPKPLVLRQELRRIIDTAGADSAAARYRQLREHAMEEGAWDFGEWEMNELARQLAADGHTAEAIAMLELNEEFHAGSASIPRTLGGLYEEVGRREDAIAAYRRVLERSPRDQTARARLEALGAPPP